MLCLGFFRLHPPRVVVFLNSVFIPPWRATSPCSVASSFSDEEEGGKRKESSASCRLVTPAQRRLSPGSAALDPPGELLLSVSGKLWQLEPLS